MEQTFTAILNSAVRKARVTGDANPQYIINTSAGTFETLADASINYDVTNHAGDTDITESWIGRKVTFTASMSGKIIGWELADA